MAYDPMNRARRRQRRRQQLGPDARCAQCGETDLDVLVKVGKTALEAHHPLGEAHASDITMILCRSCHAQFTAAQHDDGVPLQPASTVLERLVAVTAATGSTLGVIGAGLLVFAERGRLVIQKLDHRYPDWRNHL